MWSITTWKTKAFGITVVKPGVVCFLDTMFELNVFEDLRVVADGKILLLSRSYCITSDD